MTTTAHRKDAADATTGLLWWSGRILSWVLLLVTLAVLAATVGVPRLAGATPYTILTGSMKPAMPPGSLIVVRKTDADDLGIGTPVTYQLESGKSTVVTHRIVAVGTNARGERTFTMQGDANNTADEKPVRPAQIRGAVWYHLPYVGYLNTWITGEQHIVLLTVVVSALLLYAAYMFVSAAIVRSRARRIPQHSLAGDV